MCIHWQWQVLKEVHYRCRILSPSPHARSTMLRLSHTSIPFLCPSLTSRQAPHLSSGSERSIMQRPFDQCAPFPTLSLPPTLRWAPHLPSESERPTMPRPFNQCASFPAPSPAPTLRWALHLSSKSERLIMLRPFHQSAPFSAPSPALTSRQAPSPLSSGVKRLIMLTSTSWRTTLQKVPLSNVSL